MSFLRSLLTLTTLSVLLLSTGAHGYQLQTHSDMSDEAFQMSGLSLYLDGELQLTANSQFDANSIDRSSLPFSRNDGTPGGWIREGSVREDDMFSLGQLGPRYMYHFYNPLPGAPNGGGLWHPPYMGLASLDWGLEDPQNFSLNSARQYFYSALTARYADYREQQMALTFRTVGQLAHLIQDTLSANVGETVG